jgi:aspartyl-tRNA(Asn)/glutamyl-tRNA(Gln) amidotransferase subunit C
MKLTRDAVKHVAKLANLPLTPQEEEKYSKQLSRILDYIDQLNSVDTSDVEPTFNVSGRSNVMSEDKLGDCTISQGDALSNTPKKQDGFFVTKGVFQEE